MILRARTVPSDHPQILFLHEELPDPENHSLLLPVN